MRSIRLRPARSVVEKGFRQPLFGRQPQSAPQGMPLFLQAQVFSQLVKMWPSFSVYRSLLQRHLRVVRLGVRGVDCGKGWGVSIFVGMVVGRYLVGSGEFVGWECGIY